VQVRGLRLQLIGIHAPGPRDLCAVRGKGEFSCARSARKRMGELVGKGVACDIVDVGGDTLHGRCRVAEGDLSRLLVAAGVARAVKDGPFEPDQAAALSAQRGLWGADIILPKEWETVRRRNEKE
jgi:endonuclease YncB( thermonuclease family)